MIDSAKVTLLYEILNISKEELFIIKGGNGETCSGSGCGCGCKSKQELARGCGCNCDPDTASDLFCRLV